MLSLYYSKAAFFPCAPTWKNWPMAGISMPYLITCCNYWFGSQHKQKLDIHRVVQCKGNALCFGNRYKQDTFLTLSAQQATAGVLHGWNLNITWFQESFITRNIWEDRFNARSFRAIIKMRTAWLHSWHVNIQLCKCQSAYVVNAMHAIMHTGNADR